MVIKRIKEVKSQFFMYTNEIKLPARWIKEKEKRQTISRMKRDDDYTL